MGIKSVPDEDVPDENTDTPKEFALGDIDQKGVHARVPYGPLKGVTTGATLHQHKRDETQW